jgi:hypothetical protein
MLSAAGKNLQLMFLNLSPKKQKYAQSQSPQIERIVKQKVEPFAVMVPRTNIVKSETSSINSYNPKYFLV